MEKKNLKTKSKVWVCPKGCDLSKRSCRHLENKLPSMKAGTFSAESRQLVANNMITESLETDTKKYRDYEAKLAGMGFKQYEITLIMDRFISKLSISEITKRHGYVSTWVVVKLLDHLSKTLGYLHEVKFGQ